MSEYTCSPIKTREELLEAVKFIHFACYGLCKGAFGKYLPNSGNMGVFCHYDTEFEFLKSVQAELCEPSSNPDTKYFNLREPIVVPAQGDVPETTYEYLYIRRPNLKSPQAGDVDFMLEQDEFEALKARLLGGEVVPGARIFDRPDLDMIELYNSEVDALAYVSPSAMTEKVRTKQSDLTKL